MQIPLTIPLQTTKGRIFGEVYVSVEIFVTHPATAQTWNSPADGPEWEVDKVMLQLGSWKDLKAGDKPRFVDDLHDMPEWLQKPVQDYIDSKDGQTDIAECIQDGSY